MKPLTCRCGRVLGQSSAATLTVMLADGRCLVFEGRVSWRCDCGRRHVWKPLDRQVVGQVSEVQR